MDSSLGYFMMKFKKTNQIGSYILKYLFNSLIFLPIEKYLILTKIYSNLRLLVNDSFL